MYEKRESGSVQEAFTRMVDCRASELATWHVVVTCEAELRVVTAETGH